MTSSEVAQYHFLFKLLLSQKIRERHSNKGTANVKYGLLKKCLQKAAFGELGEKYPHANYHPWFKETVKQKIKDKKEAYQKWLNSKCPEDGKIYVTMRMETKREVIRAKKDMWLKICDEIDYLYN